MNSRNESRGAMFELGDGLVVLFFAHVGCKYLDFDRS